MKKLRILIVNKYYYTRGGDCIYSMELENLLKRKGHQVAVFSMHHKNNSANNYQEYWLSTLDYSRNVKNIRETLVRPIYSKEVSQKFSRILADFNPDIVHLNNIHTQISPLIAELSYKAGKKVIWTLHDYKLICPSYTCQRKNKPCMLCNNSKWNVVKNKCIKDSYIGSILGYVEIMKWNIKRLESFTEKFICPSAFLKNSMINGGGREEKYIVLPNFISHTRVIDEPIKKRNYLCYFGRFSEEKGVPSLLKAMSSLPELELKLIGTGPLLEKLKSDHAHKFNIEFIGFRRWEELKEIVMNARFSVVPSEWYENNPLSVLESFALGTPVLGARIGGLPELIIENYNGLLFEPGNVSELVNKIKELNEAVCEKTMSENSIRFIKEGYTDEKYYDSIFKIYSEALNK